MIDQGSQERRPPAPREWLFPVIFTVFGVVLAASLLALDSAGVFIYLPFTLAFCCVLLYVVIGTFKLFAGGAAISSHRANALVVISIAALITFTVMLPSLRTSDRKGFWLDVQALEAGMPTTEAIERMASYRLLDTHQGSGHITFSFRTSLQTEDSVVLTLSADRALVSTVRFSPD